MAIDLEQYLSPHFTLHELTASQTATRKGIKEQFEPPQEIIDNLKSLCENLLEKLRLMNDNKPLHLSSLSFRIDQKITGLTAYMV